MQDHYDTPNPSQMKPGPYPNEIRQQSQGVFGSRKHLAKNKQSEEALSVSTLSNEDFRKRQPS